MNLNSLLLLPCTSCFSCLMCNECLKIIRTQRECYNFTSYLLIYSPLLPSFSNSRLSSKDVFRFYLFKTPKSQLLFLLIHLLFLIFLILLLFSETLSHFLIFRCRHQLSTVAVTFCSLMCNAARSWTPGHILDNVCGYCLCFRILRL